MKNNGRFTDYDRAVHTVLLEAADHYYSSNLIADCHCQVCKAVRNLEKIVGEEDLVNYMTYAKEKISEHKNEVNRYSATRYGSSPGW
jgi:hypothetical protein